MTEQPIRVGIIGTGRVGIDWHLPDIRVAGGVVAALADVQPGRAGRFAQQHDVPLAFDDYRALIARDEVDVVAVCTPPYTHAEIAVAALEAGKHVYLEKPPTMNEAQMQAIADAKERTGQLMMCGSNRVFEHEVQALRRRIVDGELGHIYLVECLKLLRRSIAKGWHREKKYAGGGVGMNSAAHRVDLVLYLLGTPDVDAVTAQTYGAFAHRTVPTRGYLLRDVEEGLWPQDKVADVEDMLVAQVHFATGCTWYLRDASICNMPEEWQVRLYGTAAGATLNPLMIYGEDQDQSVTDTWVNTPPNPKGAHVLAYEHFFACIRQGVETDSPPERSVMVMRIMDAIYASAANGGKQVRWQD